MSWIKRLGGRLPDFEDVVRRFPVPVAIMAVFTIWIIAENHFNLRLHRDEEYVYFGFILAGYISVIAALCVEARKGTSKLGALIGVTLALPAFLLSYFSQKLDFIAPIAIGGAIIFLGNAAAWRMGREDRKVWNFTQKLWTGALFAAVGCVIFTLGMSAISEAVRALFGINLNDLTMETILPIGLGFLAPIYWLGTLPRYGEAADVTELSFEARALSFLGTWMLAPLVIIYALIVLVYGVKILLQWDLPKGEIALLVSPFIGVGMLVWLMLEPKVLKESGFVRFYRAAWHWVMLPAAVLLGVAVFVRIGEYGLTAVRFFLVLVVIWAVVQSLWFLFLPVHKRDIRIPTGLAAILLMFAAFTVYPLPVLHQTKRATAALIQLEPLSKATLKANPQDAKKFSAALDYLMKLDADTQLARLLPSKELTIVARKKDWIELRDELGLSAKKVRSDRQYYSVRIESLLPADLPAGELHGPFRLQVSENNYDVYGNIVKENEGYRLTLDVKGRSYELDLTQYLEDGVDMDSSIDVNLIPAVKIPPIPLISEHDSDAFFIVTPGGTITYRYDEIETVRFNGMILMAD